jgi:uncharacterized DUF497 family protein
MAMEIGFDPNKDAINIERHQVPLAFGARVFDDPLMLIIPTIRAEDQEDRYKAIGTVGGKLWTSIHVYRDPVIWFVSVRRSNEGEKRAYDSHPG